MTKEEFFKMRDEMRANGQLQISQPIVYKDPELNAAEEAEALNLLKSQKVVVVRTDGTFGKWLKINVDYVGNTVKVCRKQVDEIDNLYIYRR